MYAQATAGACRCLPTPTENLLLASLALQRLGPHVRAACRMLLSPSHRNLSTDLSSELNQEMAQCFGSGPDGKLGGGSLAHDCEPQLQSDVALLNSELFRVLGKPQQAADIAAPAAQHADIPQRAEHTAHPLASFGKQSFGDDSSSAHSAQQQGLTHVDGGGKAAMVDVSSVSAAADAWPVLQRFPLARLQHRATHAVCLPLVLEQKAATVRTASAAARVVLGPEVFQLVAQNQLKKGDVLTVAQLAGEGQEGGAWRIDQLAQIAAKGASSTDHRSGCSHTPALMQA